MKLLIGTHNQAKFQRWKDLLGEGFEVLSPQEIDVHPEFEEGMESLEENALLKAQKFCEASGLPTLSDDTGYYIAELNGRPGVAVRRWGGQLPEDVSDADWLAFFREQIAPIKDTSAYFAFCTAVAFPDGTQKTFSYESHGYIDKDRLHEIPEHEQGYPSGYCFIHDELGKAYYDMTPEERIEAFAGNDREIIEFLKSKNPTN